MHTDYLSPAIQQLRDHQVQFAPREKQLEQLDSAEKLLNQLDPQRTYTCEYVCHRVTRNGYVSNRDLTFTGEVVRHDLRLFIEDLSDVARPLASAAGERVLTIDELTREFCVSTKTVSRWRRQGLVSRRFLFEGCQRLGFLQSSVNRFVAQYEQRVHRAARFSHVTDAERERIIARARSLALAGGGPAAVTKRLAHETGRTAETIRCLLRRFDREHPDMAILPDRHRPLRTETRSQIYRQYRHGDSVAALAQQFSQTQTTIRRIINAMRAADIMALPLDYIGNEEYARLSSRQEEAEILGSLQERDLPTKTLRLPKAAPAYLASLYEVPLLTREQEIYLFRKMNYLKYKASTLRTHADWSQPKRSWMDQIEKLYDEFVVTKNLIIRANLRLVVSIAKRYVGSAGDFFELVSDGNMSLIRAADKFDVSRGNRFSTYASWAIMKNFARTIPHAFLHRGRFCTSCPDMLSTVEDVRPNHREQESAQIQRESHVERLLDRLDPRERQIVVSRFGLIRGTEPLRLQQVGAAMGVSKERVRQIQCRAISKLRKAAEEDRIEDLV